jgi:ATP-dependent DNA ligase
VSGGAPSEKLELPVPVPLDPMLAKKVDALPQGEWLYEPKWDGFRAIVLRDGDRWLLQSRDLKPLNRYFPELEAPILGALPPRCAVDGEIVIAREGRLDFEALQLRIHPAKSRVDMLAGELPASLVIWDLLCVGDRSLLEAPFAERRAELEKAIGAPAPPIHLTPITADREVATDWFERFEGAGFDGVMAKDPKGTYQPGKRAMFKVKHQRTADCVVAGFRWHKNGQGTLVGSLLLGLYDDGGVLHHIGVAASFSEKKRAELVDFLAPYRENALEGHPWAGWMDAMESMQRRPGAQSRWNRDKTLSWEALRPELVVEVSYDHMQGTRLRHTAHFVRWRPDKPAAACRYDQLEVTPAIELQKIFAR